MPTRKLPQIISLAAATALAAAWAMGASCAHAAPLAYVAPPVPAITIPVSPAPAPLGTGALPTSTVSFQSALSAGPQDQLDGWLWRPAGARVGHKVPLVIVAHGHSGPWSAGDVSQVGSEFRLLAQKLRAKHIGMLLVDSFSAPRNAWILAQHAADPNAAQWAIRPNGLNSDPAYRDPAVSEDMVRPYDLLGAAAAVPSLAPWADTSRMVAIGFSHGGSAVLALALSQHPVNLGPGGQISPTGGRVFRVLYATYPGCGLGGVNSHYAHSAMVVPTRLGTGTADTTTPPGASPGQPSTPGYCRDRFDQAVAASAAAPAGAGLSVPLWVNYAGATHSWNVTPTPANNAARADWFARLIADITAL